MEGHFRGCCWIAEAIWGVTDVRTRRVRAYLNGPFSCTWYGKLIMAAYVKIGRRVSRMPWAVRALTPLFNFVLRKADKYVMG